MKTESPHGECHGAEGTDGRQRDDHFDDRKYHPGELIHQIFYEGCTFAQVNERQTEQRGDQNHLQDGALCEGVDHGDRDDAQQERHDALGMLDS